MELISLGRPAFNSPTMSQNTFLQQRESYKWSASAENMIHVWHSDEEALSGGRHRDIGGLQARSRVAVQSAEQHGMTVFSLQSIVTHGPPERSPNPRLPGL